MNSVVFLLGAKAFHRLHHHSAVPAAVKNGNVPCFGKILPESPQIVPRLLMRLGARDRMHDVAARIQRAGYALDIPSYRVGDFDTELCEEFLKAFVRESKITLHVRQLAGTNSHHIIEGAFKALGRALSAASEIDAKFALL